MEPGAFNFQELTTGELLTLLEFLLELGESIDIAQSGLLDVARLCYRLLLGLLPLLFRWKAREGA